MNPYPTKPGRINTASRCTHLSAAGGRCRTIASSGSLCAVHARADANRREAGDLAATLTSGLDAFTSAEPINHFLSRLLLLLAQDRISPRRGAVMAYTANLILRTVSVMDAEKEQEPRHIEYVIGIPRPDYGNTTSDAKQAASSESASLASMSNPSCHRPSLSS